MQEKVAGTADDRGGFLIKKSTMIQKNLRRIEDVYKIDKKTLGTGAYGIVSRVKHKDTGQIRAVKKVAKKKIKNMERFQQEITILQMLDHPNVLKLYEYFEDAKNVYLITELCTGGELFDRIIKEEFFSEKVAARIFKQILQPLNYCHQQGIAHRDLKPENFLFETDEPDADIKVIDFGLSKILKHPTLQDGLTNRANVKDLDRMNTRAGTPNYISPEVLAGNYGVECDLWSAGCILYILLCGYPPFYGDDDQQILEMVQRGKFDFDGEEWDEISKEAKDLIKKLICKPEKRLTAEEALQHKWFKKALKGEEVKELKGNKLANFKNFQKNSKLKQVALTAISVQASPDDIKELKDLFKQLDVNGDGSLSLDELKKGLAGKANGDNILDLLRSADTDGSGEINYTEFLAATIDQTVFMRDDYLRTTFRLFDKDGSGKIDNEEVVALLQGDEIGNLVSQDAIGKAMAEIDQNGDGEIDFEEFMAMMKKATEIDDQAH